MRNNNNISKEINTLIPKLQQYFMTQPVEKVYIVGSCSRGEENENSDLDIVVNYIDSDDISLMTIGGIISDLEKIAQRPIDLIEEDCILPFAKETIERDKFIIYERTH